MFLNRDTNLSNHWTRKPGYRWQPARRTIKKRWNAAMMKRAICDRPFAVSDYSEQNRKEIFVICSSCLFAVSEGRSDGHGDQRLMRRQSSGWPQYVSHAQPWAPECPDVKKNYKWWPNPVWHRMLHSCTHMATVGVKGLKSVCEWNWLPDCM